MSEDPFKKVIKQASIDEIIWCPKCKSSNVKFLMFDSREEPIWTCGNCNSNFEPLPTTVIPEKIVLAEYDKAEAKKDEKIGKLNQELCDKDIELQDQMNIIEAYKKSEKAQENQKQKLQHLQNNVRDYLDNFDVVDYLEHEKVAYDQFLKSKFFVLLNTLRSNIENMFEDLLKEVEAK